MIILTILLLILLLYLNKTIQYNEGFTNYDTYFKDILSKDEKKNLNILTDTLIKLLDKRNIDYFFAFGSLIGVVRHGFRMPWDDDIDIIIDSNNVNKLLKGLQLKKSNKSENVYYLNDNVLIIHKNWGIPLKLKYKNSNYPFIDINTYTKKNNKIVVDKNQLLYGHIKSFNELESDIFPVKKAKFDKFIIKIPKNYNKILKNQYGPDILNTCKITYNHKPYCKNNNCENENASEHIHTEFNIKDINKKYINPKIYD